MELQIEQIENELFYHQEATTKRYHLKKHLKQPSFMNGTYTIRFSIETSYQYRHDHKQRKIHQSHPNMLQ